MQKLQLCFEESELKKYRLELGAYAFCCDMDIGMLINCDGSFNLPRVKVLEDPEYFKDKKVTILFRNELRNVKLGDQFEEPCEKNVFTLVIPRYNIIELKNYLAKDSQIYPGFKVGDILLSIDEFNIKRYDSINGKYFEPCGMYLGNISSIISQYNFSDIRSVFNDFNTGSLEVVLKILYYQSGKFKKSEIEEIERLTKELNDEQKTGRILIKEVLELRKEVKALKSIIIKKYTTDKGI